MAVKINKLLGTINRTAKTRTKKDIKYIVIHYVGALGDAKACAQYYASTYAGASADFYVGHTGDIWQGNDYFSGYSWHCGGGRQSSSGGTYYKKCTNANSIGLEMCVKNDGDTSAPNADWYFWDATVEATIELVKYLMQELEIDADHVIRHYDVTGKYCPAPYLDEYHKGAWEKFKAKISGSATEAVETTETKEAATQIYRVRKSWTDAASQIGAYENLENAKKVCKEGYSVYDESGTAVYTAQEEEKSGSEYSVKITSDVLHIRKGPGTNYEAVGYTGKGTFTIVEEQSSWGRLKSGAGWICLTVSCVKKV